MGKERGQEVACGLLRKGEKKRRGMKNARDRFKGENEGEKGTSRRESRTWCKRMKGKQRERERERERERSRGGRHFVSSRSVAN